MDIISHGLWGGIAFGRRKHFIAAFLFGILPDILAFVPFFIYTQLNGIHFHRQPPLEIIPSWVFDIYNLSHSLLLSCLICLIIRKVNKESSLYYLAWPLHILFDIPTHPAEFFPTRFLYPVSDFSIDGRLWTSPIIWYPNIIILTIFYGIFIFLRVRGRKKQNKLTAIIRSE